MMSNSLKIEDENSLLGFLFNYSENIGGVYPSATVAYITNLLASALRYNFLCLRKMLSAIRRNEWLRGNKTFISHLKKEMAVRVKQSNNSVLMLSSLDT